MTDEQPISPAETPAPAESDSGAASIPTGDDFIETYSVSDLVSEGYTGIPDYLLGPVKDDHSDSADGPVKPDE